MSDFYKKWHLKSMRVVVDDQSYISQIDVHKLHEHYQTELAQLKEKCEQWEKAYLEKQDQFVNETKRASDLYEKCAEYEKVLKSIDTDTEIDEQGREWRMDKDDMRIISRNVLEKWKGKD